VPAVRSLWRPLQLARSDLFEVRPRFLTEKYIFWFPQLRHLRLLSHPVSQRQAEWFVSWRLHVANSIVWSGSLMSWVQFNVFNVNHIRRLGLIGIFESNTLEGFEMSHPLYTMEFILQTDTCSTHAFSMLKLKNSVSSCLWCRKPFRFMQIIRSPPNESDE